MLTEWVRMGGIQPAAIVQHVGATMHRFRMRFLTAALGAAMLFVANPSFAQNSEQKPGEKPGDKPQAGDAKEAQKKIDEFAEAEKLLGGPAANPECLWLGRRVVSLLWRDDLDTAFRHLDLYDRFGCPAGHIQATFRCLVRQGNIDPKAADTLNSRVHGCWVNPNAEPQGTAAVPSGTTNR
jgi:hypothetical protein